MDIELVDDNQEYFHSIISFEFEDDQKEMLLNSFRLLGQTSNLESAKKTIYEMTGLTPNLEENPVPDTDLNGYMEWLFDQHGFIKSPSTTLTQK